MPFSVRVDRQWYTYGTGDVSGGQLWHRTTTFDAATQQYSVTGNDDTNYKGKATHGAFADLQFALAKAKADGLLKEIGDARLGMPDPDSDGATTYGLTVTMGGKRYSMNGKDLPGLVLAMDHIGDKDSDFQQSGDFTGTISMKDNKVTLSNVQSDMKSRVGRPLIDPKAVFVLDKARDGSFFSPAPALRDQPRARRAELDDLPGGQLDGQTVTGKGFFDPERAKVELLSVAGVAKQDADLHKTGDPSSPVVDHVKKGDPVNLALQYQKGAQVWVTHPTVDLKHFPGYAPASSFGVGSDLDHAIDLQAPSDTAGLLGGLEKTTVEGGGRTKKP